MNTEILGTDFKYIIDVSHGINRDGFIAIGTESVVYKGIKTSRKAELEFACVLKFKPKYVYSNGEYIDKISKFKDEELSIFEELQECRSVVRIFDVIEDLGDFSLPCDKVTGGVINREKYFCVIVNTLPTKGRFSCPQKTPCHSKKFLSFYFGSIYCIVPGIIASVKTEPFK